MKKTTDHHLALKPQLMSREERIENMSNLPSNRKGLIPNKIFESGASVKDIYQMVSHGSDRRSNNTGRPLSYDNVEEFEKQIGSYFEYCEEKQLIPARPGLGLWLGLDSTTLSEWKNDPTNKFADSIKRAEEAMHMFTLQKTSEGKINPILYFFISKNWYGMQDKTEIVHKSSSTQAIDITEQQRILRNTPGVVIDADFKETESQSYEDLATEDLARNLSGE